MWLIMQYGISEAVLMTTPVFSTVSHFQADLTVYRQAFSSCSIVSTLVATFKTAKIHL